MNAAAAIFLEHDWNPQADLQAMDRAHRIGQTSSLHVYRLFVPGSIEERILDVQHHKAAVARAIVNDENSAMVKLGTDRVIDLLGDASDANTANRTATANTSGAGGGGGGGAGGSGGGSGTGGANLLVDEQYRELDIEQFLRRTRALDKAAAAAATADGDDHGDGDGMGDGDEQQQQQQQQQQQETNGAIHAIQ